MKKIALGAATGVTSLLIAVPLFAQMAGAAPSSASAKMRPVPTQARVLAMGHMEGDMKMKMHGKMAEKLGMTEDELRTALDSGKTMQEIATKKGITLPTRPMGDKGNGMMKSMR